MSISPYQINKNLEFINQEIFKSASASGRNCTDIKVVVVTKRQPVDLINAAWEAGARIFGENYPEEAAGKIISMNDKPDIQWHMIGHLQSRKVRIVTENFQLLHSLDSIHLAQKINTFCSEQNKILPVMLEFNLSGENTKSGWPAWEESKWDLLIPNILSLINLHHLNIVGLMTMPPLYENPEETRPYFRKMKNLKVYLEKYITGIDFRELSMGTSSDYRIAIEEGATYVRIGQAILGERPAKVSG